MKLTPNSKTRRTLSILLALAALPAVHAASDTWTGTTDGSWAAFTNWVSGTGVPGTGDTATFDSAGGAVDLIDLGGGVTISNLEINSAAADAYTIGVSGVDTLTIDGLGANDQGIRMDNAVAVDQTIAADVVLGDGAAETYRIQNLSADADLIITGDLSTGTGGTAGDVTLNVGNFNPASRTVRMEGDILANVTASRLTIVLAGAELEMNGTVNGTTNTMRTDVRNDGNLTVGATGAIGQGNLTVRNGTATFTNTTTPQLLDNTLTLGHATGAVGSATVTIVPGATLEMDGNIVYAADDDMVNTGLITGGTVDLSGANRNINVGDNPLVVGAELDVATNFKGNGDTNGASEDLNIIGEGTLLWNSTIDTSVAGEFVDTVFFSCQKTIVGPSGTMMTGPRRSFRVAQRNSATLSDFDVELDINGETVTLNDDLVLGVYNNNNVSEVKNVRVTDSADSASSKIVFTDDNDLKVNNGSGTGGGVGTNLQAFVEADLQFEGSGFSIDVEEGTDEVDCEISGTITDDGGGNRDFSKNGDGTLRLTATNNLYNFVNLNRGTLIITNDGALGDNDVQLGATSTDGTFIYDGPGETIDNQFRIGNNNATATGEGSILNNGTGALTFSANDFNQERATAEQALTLTLGGSFTGGDNVIQNAIIDNNTGVGGTVGITKTGDGSWILAGDNTYTGDTDVQAGRLEVNGTVGGSLTVAAGASVGGSATYAGTVTLGAGTELHINAAGGGAITATGAIDTSGGVTVFMDSTAGGAITVLNYNSGAANNISASNFTLAPGTPVSARGAGTFVDTGSAITIDLGFEDKTWDGSLSDVWDINTTANWTGGDSLFLDGDNVSFDDTLTGSGTVDLGSSVAPGLVTFSNDGTAYTIGGSGAIAGSTALWKTGPGIATVNTANSFTGGTRIEQGQLVVGDDAALGTGTVTWLDLGVTPDLVLTGAAPAIANDLVFEDEGSVKQIHYNVAGGNAVLSGDITNNEVWTWPVQIIMDATATITLSGTVSGPGAVRPRNGTLILTNAANTFTGPLRSDQGGTTVISTIADTGVASTAGAGSYMIVGSDNGNGILSYTGSGNSTDRRVQVGAGGGNTPDVGHTGSATVASNGTGALVFTNATFSYADTSSDGKVGPRTLTLAGTNTDDNEIQGAITDNAGTIGAGTTVDNTVGLIKEGPGKWILSGVNTYTGDTTVDEGTLGLTQAAALPPGADVSVAESNGAILNLDFSGSVTIGKLFIDGVAVAIGEWGATGSGAANQTDALTGAGLLNVTDTEAATGGPVITDIRHLGATVELDIAGLDAAETYRVYRDTTLPLSGAKVQIGGEITGTTSTMVPDNGPLPVEAYYQVEQQ